MIDPSSTQAATPESSGSSDDHSTFLLPPEADSARPLPLTGDRYELREVIAHGGMGIIWLAWDRVLNREVAVKILREISPSLDPTASDRIRHRFLAESQINAQLQHPGIPAVHDLGRFADGTPFLVMKLVKGKTLQTLLEEKTHPALDPTEFLLVFEQICRTVGYAHAHQVIHRDLKPSNIMIGAFGEVQIVDWGLAKVLLRPGTELAESDSESTQIRVPGQATGSHTHVGSVLGTPHSMSPEQALGETERVREPSDVFGLGAILAAVLTGKPPFPAATGEASRQMAARWDITACFARLDACGAEPEVIALCKKCLQHEPEDRYLNGEAVAEAVAQLRAAAMEKARRSEVERVRLEAERAQERATLIEQQKRRRILRVLGLVVGLLVVAIVAGIWRYQVQAAQTLAEQRLRDATDQEAATLAMAQAESALRRDNPSLAEIDAALTNAGQRLAGAETSDLGRRLEMLRSQRHFLEQLERVGNLRWSIAAGKRTLDLDGVRIGYASAFREHQLDVLNDSLDELARKIRQSPLANRLQMALEEWLEVERNPRLAELLAVLDPHPRHTAIRKAVAQENWGAIVPLLAERPKEPLPPSLAILVGSSRHVPDEVRELIMQRSQEAHPRHFGLALTLAATLPQNDHAACLTYLRVAVAIRPDNPVARIAMGIIHTRAKRLDSAILAYREAIKLEPTNLLARVGLGNAQHLNGETAEAIATFRELAQRSPRESEGYLYLGRVLHSERRFSEAMDAYKEHIRLTTRYAPCDYSLGALFKEPADLNQAVQTYTGILKQNARSVTAHHNLARIEWWQQLLPRLPRVVATQEKPQTAEECCEFAALCGQPFEARFASATRLYGEAFQQKPLLADDLFANHRYQAACCAVRASRGEGADAPGNPEQRSHLRRQALRWLQADLSAWAKLARSPDAGERQKAADALAHWLQQGSLDPFSHGAAMPEPRGEEPQLWARFWDEVRATRKTALGQP